VETFAKLRGEREGVEWAWNGVILRMSSSETESSDCPQFPQDEAALRLHLVRSLLTTRAQLVRMRVDELLSGVSACETEEAG